MSSYSVRHLIVNADDFGLSEGVNRGILRAHTEGILTSTSLMVRQPAAADAAAASRAHPRLSVGLHVDLAEWVFRDGQWQPLYQVVATDNANAVQAEAQRQLEMFRSQMRRDPTHIDSHQHVHREEPVRSVLIALAGTLDVPLRDCSSIVRFCGDFYGQTGEGEPFPEGTSVENLLELLHRLQPGWTELSCHPGDDELLESVYSAERRVELETLCSPRVRAEVQKLQIQLRSFADLPRRTGPIASR